MRGGHGEKIVATKVTEKKESETQTEPTLRAEDSEKDTTYGKIQYMNIESKYFYKGNGCRREDSCFLTVTERKKTDERVCHYWLEGCADTLRIYADLANIDMGKLYRIVIGGQGGSTPGV